MNFDATTFVFLALLSRIILVVAFVACDRLFADHDAQGVAYFDGSLTSPWSSFSKWDSAHFLNIAKYGYINDFELVFLPGYPFLMRWTSQLLNLSLSCSGVVLSLLFYCLSAYFFHGIIGALKLKKEIIAWALLIFLLSPANVFFVTVYSESMFMAFSFAGSYFVLNNKPAIATLFYAMTSLVRSNGVLNACFICIPLLCSSINCSLKCTIFYLSMAVFGAFIVVCPFLIWESMSLSYLRNCFWSLDEEFASSVASLVDVPVFHSAYQYLQSQYWNVGFLRYYQWKQWPNFLLAIPAWLIGLSILGSSNRIFSLTGINSTRRYWIVAGLLQLAISLYTCIFIAHVQISTRMLFSSSPLMTIGLAYLLEASRRPSSSVSTFSSLTVTEKAASTSPASSNTALTWFILSYLVVFNVAGFVLHSNFYPWT